MSIDFVHRLHGMFGGQPVRDEHLLAGADEESRRCWASRLGSGTVQCRCCRALPRSRARSATRRFAATLTDWPFGERGGYAFSSRIGPAPCRASCTMPIIATCSPASPNSRRQASARAIGTPASKPPEVCGSTRSGCGTLTIPNPVRLSGASVLSTPCAASSSAPGRDGTALRSK